MKAIAAVDQNLGIGKDNDLLIHISEDMKRFRRLTMGKTVVMGHSTLKSFPGGKPLPKRENIVFTRSEQPPQEGVTFVHSLSELRDALQGKNMDDVYVIGGGMIYSLLLPYCDELNLTIVEHGFDATVFFPDFRRDETWVSAGISQTFTEDFVKYRFEDYWRTEPPKSL